MDVWTQVSKGHSGNDQETQFSVSITKKRGLALKLDNFWGKATRKINTFHFYFEFLMDLRHTGRQTDRERNRNIRVTDKKLIT